MKVYFARRRDRQAQEARVGTQLAQGPAGASASTSSRRRRRSDRCRRSTPTLYGPVPSNPLPDASGRHADEGGGHAVLGARSSVRRSYPGVNDVTTGGAKTANRVLTIAKVISDRVPRRRRPARHGVDAADSEHDPAVDLRPATGDRGDEARRGDELVRPRAVHARGAALRLRRLGPRGDPARDRQGGRAALDPARTSAAAPTSTPLPFVAERARRCSAPGCCSGAAGSGLTLRRFLQV